MERPPQARLLREIQELGFSATGRRYGVSDNAIRKWIRQYEIHEGPNPAEECEADVLAEADGLAALHQLDSTQFASQSVRSIRVARPASTDT